MANTFLHLFILLAFPPLLLGVINKTKAQLVGRQGAPILQPYYDLWRLFQKGAVYSTSSSWIFRAGPIVGLATALLAGLILPFGALGAPLSFEGDVILFAYLFALGRFFTMAAALDTASSFEGMGASREAAFSALTEPTLFVVLTILCVKAQSVSFLQASCATPWYASGLAQPAFLAAAIALFVVLLSENSRIPFDDPTTHLELTMIHEVMVLDHSGPDFAYILYGAAIKLFVLGTLLVQLLLPCAGLDVLASTPLLLAGLLLLAVVIGVVEASLARIRLLRVPQFLVAALAMSILGLAAVFFRG